MKGKEILGNSVDKKDCFNLGKVEKEIGIRKERIIKMMYEM